MLKSVRSKYVALFFLCICYMSHMQFLYTPPILPLVGPPIVLLLSGAIGFDLFSRFNGNSLDWWLALE